MPNDWKGRLNLQRTERAPDALELFAKGPHEATGTYEIGDPNLRKENAIGAEIGLSRDFGPLRIDAALFHTRYQGYIYKRITGNTCGEDFDTCVAGDGEELKQIAYDQRDARFTGAEFAARYEIMPIGPGTFGFDGQFDIVRARFADGANVPRIPPMRVGAGMFWTGAGISARLGLLHAFAQKRILDAEETPTSGYNLLRAELSYVTPIGAPANKRELTIGLTGTNLLNADVRLHTSFRKDEVLQPGRGVRAFVNVKF
jgi:iron complex outermembrane receptor protein